MVTVLKKGRPISEIIKKINDLMSKRNHGIQSTKYSGKIKSQIDPIAYQKHLRNEWE